MLIPFAQESTEGGAFPLHEAAACVSHAAAGVGPIDALAQRFDRAVESLSSGEAQCAFADLSALANQGYGPASRIALMLTRRGTSLFGGAFPSTARQRACWQCNG